MIAVHYMQNMHHACGPVLVRIAFTGKFWQAVIRAKIGHEDYPPGELLEIMEFHPTSDIWHVRETLAAQDRKSAGRWCREGESNRDGIFSRADFEARQRDKIAREWDEAVFAGCECLT